MTTTSQNQADGPGRHITDNPGVLLGVWAHPDDEAYLSAGLMALARAAGNRVVVATATKGELGTDDPDAFPPQRLAALREREIAASLAALDVREHRWLGHRDGRLHRVDPARGVRQIRALIDEIQPDTIVTFGPDGMTGHTDHQTICGWVTTAWQQSGQPSRLWYATVTPEFHRDWSDVNAQVGFWFDGTTPPCDPTDELALALPCDEHTLNRKFAALRAHTSQTAPLIEQLGPQRYRRWWSTESFVDASRHDRRIAA